MRSAGPATFLILASFLILAACRDDKPPAPTAEQANQLNEADSMLNDLANEEGPAANATGPSNSTD